MTMWCSLNDEIYLKYSNQITDIFTQEERDDRTSKIKKAIYSHKPIKFSDFSERNL